MLMDKKIWKVLPSGQDDFKLLRNFVKSYGNLAARELIAFVLEHNEGLRINMKKFIELRVGLRELIPLLQAVWVFLSVQEIQKQVVNFQMMLSPNELVAFRLSLA